jgi:hypothetical protein
MLLLVREPTMKEQLMTGIRRAMVIVTLASAAATITVAPAFAGQFAPGPGFASGNASCLGSATTFAAHYGDEGQYYPQVVHGSVGPAISADATTDAAGTVGDFNSTLAQSHGSIMACLP